ncbi:metallophosphoesterase [Halosolutus amylolyticus]|uniref:Metallophosphoesterase n=1 Tax=Halosolutus amylolyticus TaxID=2932267 RepID=A0ABD5PV92_9EURY|nr:metallophosphoesterase [Halosolutus amylolyticus]
MTETGVEIDVPFSIHERAVVVPAAEALVLADVHLGRGAASSVDAPIDDGADVVARLEDALAATTPETVVVAGDLLHSFSRLPHGVEDDLSRLRAAVDRAGASLVVARGNHDTMLDPVFDGDPVDEYRLESKSDGATIVCHGHERPDGDADRYVIGHDHPAISIDGRKRPCFLYGPGAYEGSDVLVLPAFTRLARGATVNGMFASDFQSPLVTDPDAFYPAVWDDANDEPLWFPPLGECRRLL